MEPPPELFYVANDFVEPTFSNPAKAEAEKAYRQKMQDLDNVTNQSITALESQLSDAQTDIDQKRAELNAELTAENELEREDLEEAGVIQTLITRIENTPDNIASYDRLINSLTLMQKTTWEIVVALTKAQQFWEDNANQAQSIVRRTEQLAAEGEILWKTPTAAKRSIEQAAEQWLYCGQANWRAYMGLNESMEAMHDFLTNLPEKDAKAEQSLALHAQKQLLQKKQHPELQDGVPSGFAASAAPGQDAEKAPATSLISRMLSWVF